MLTNFLHALVQNWELASGQMALVPTTVWMSKGECICVCVCVCMCACARVCLSACVNTLSTVFVLEAVLCVSSLPPFPHEIVQKETIQSSKIINKMGNNLKVSHLFFYFSYGLE